MIDIELGVYQCSKAFIEVQGHGRLDITALYRSSMNGRLVYKLCFNIDCNNYYAEIALGIRREDIFNALASNSRTEIYPRFVLVKYVDSYDKKAVPDSTLTADLEEDLENSQYFLTLH